MPFLNPDCTSDYILFPLAYLTSISNSNVQNSIHLPLSPILFDFSTISHKENTSLCSLFDPFGESLNVYPI